MKAAAEDAATVVAEKAERMLAKLRENDPTSAERRRQAAALVQIAAQIGGNAQHLLRADQLGSVAATDADREAAATEVYSLAMRRQSAGTTANAGAKPRAGWVAGGDDFGLPIQPDRVREAVALYDIALSLKNDPYWTYSKGLLQERLGDYAAAVLTLEAVGGSYAKYAPAQAERCRRKLGGNYNAEAALDAAFSGLLDQAERTGSKNVGMLKRALGSVRDFLAGAQHEQDLNDDEDVDTSEDVDDEQLDLAATVAQTFAERLVDGDFQLAQTMLAKELDHLSADDLRRDFTEMIDPDEVEGPGELDVCVVSSEGNMPDMRAADLGWVYVAISGDGFSEAVTVVVTREGEQMRIRELEWGRP